MTNKDLFKQAIAEAKTIREAAITNAKEALEESLTPHLKEMLAQKLQEMEEEDNMEEIVNEEDLINDPKGATAKGNVAEAEEEGEAEEAEEAEGEEEEELEIEDMTIDDLKDLIKDIIAQETGNEEELPGEEAPVGAEDVVGSEEEEIDINELLAEIEGMDNESIEEEVLNESLMGQVVDLLGVTNSQAQMIIGVLGAMGVLGASAVMSKVHDMALKGVFGSAIQAKAQELGKLGGIAKDVTQQREEVEEVSNKEMDEALNTIEELRTQLQEVNLLNAKLLYVNKVFKANNLSEGQKVNVIAAFDKAETVREVKLVFETVSKNVVAKKPTTIKEHTFASKPTGTTATPKKEVINEVSEQVLRMQKLAGIIK